MADPQAIATAVARLYDTYPFPPDPILDEPPPGYNWRWSWPAAYGFCTGGLLPANTTPRILDAGCGSGVSTEYLAHLNPSADILAIDISAGTLEVARERIRRSRPPSDRTIEFRHLSLFDLHTVPGEFDLINCVGVLHHTADPVAAIRAIAPKLAPGGLFHIFVYADIGRWEIRLMQEAIALLDGRSRTEPAPDLRRAVDLGRKVFAALPSTNRLVRRETERWALENQRDECFADMYVHPHEIDYTIHTLFDLIEASGLEFVGFSNPHIWQIERLLGNDPDLLARAQALSDRDRYRLIELLDTDIAHYEFFLTRPPLPRCDRDDEAFLLASRPVAHPCLTGADSPTLFDPDYNVCHLSEEEFACLQACDRGLTVAEILAESPQVGLDTLRSLLVRRIILIQSPS